MTMYFKHLAFLFKRKKITEELLSAVSAY